MTHDEDLEYGSTPEDSEYEHTDIEPSIATKFAVWLAIAMILSVGIVYGTFWLFEGRAQAESEAAERFPLAAGRQGEPPTPRLQWQPFRDLHVLTEEQRHQLTSYGWIDQGAGVVHIPIDEAMRLVIERGGIPASADTPQGLGQVTQDSSAGRTVAPR